ncbi:signal peptidase II [Anaerolentibacter hominis]|uniref:signal peptidase II n=1 Tax=Anaerolentibacter hominis TaxID=3079009 RepID=UPI0031B8A974
MFFVVLCAAVVWLDLKLKKEMDALLRPGEKQPILGGHIILQKTYNSGFALNKLDKKPALVNGIRLVLTLCTAFFFLRELAKGRNGWLKLGLAFILGGALSNLIEGMQKGHVVDYFSYGKLGKLKNVVFNLGDVAIIKGFVIAFLAELTQK